MYGCHCSHLKEIKNWFHIICHVKVYAVFQILHVNVPNPPILISPSTRHTENIQPASPKKTTQLIKPRIGRWIYYKQMSSRWQCRKITMPKIGELWTQRKCTAMELSSLRIPIKWQNIILSIYLSYSAICYIDNGHNKLTDCDVWRSNPMKFIPFAMQQLA